MKFLVFTTDLLPLPGLATSGTALRTFGLVEGLRAHGHQVEVSVPRGAVEALRAKRARLDESPGLEAELARLEPEAFDPGNQHGLVGRVRPDVVLCGHWPAALAFERRLSQPLVIDLAGPHLLERHYQGEGDHRSAVLGKLTALSRADFFIVSGAKQRLYFLSFLVRAGVAEPEARTLTIHMPLRPDPQERPPAAASAEYPRIVFAGVFLPWQDPSAGLLATAAELGRRGRGSLTLIGGVHTHYDIRKGVYERLFARLSELPFVRTRPLMPYPALLEELRRCDLALDLMRWNLERELAMTIRSTSYLWSGLPVVYNDFADLGRLIGEYDAGWTVPPGDEPALHRVLDEVYDDPAGVAAKGRNATRLAREVFSWDRAVLPLLARLGAGHQARLHERDAALESNELASLPVTSERPVEQRFLSRIDGLCRVECCLSRLGRAQLAPLTLSVVSLPGGEDAGERPLIARRTLAGDAVRQDEWVSVDFDPVSDSGGRTFALLIESGAKTAAESASPWASRRRPFPLLGLYHGGAPRPLTLCLRTTSARAAR